MPNNYGSLDLRASTQYMIYERIICVMSNIYIRVLNIHGQRIVDYGEQDSLLPKERMNRRHITAVRFMLKRRKLIKGDDDLITLSVVNITNEDSVDQYIDSLILLSLVFSTKQIYFKMNAFNVLSLASARWKQTS